MKICFITNTLNIDSGWGRYSWEVVYRVGQEKDIEIIVLTEEPANYPFVRPVLKNSFNNFLYIFLNGFNIREYIKDCQVIHCLDAYPYGIIGALANIGLNKKLVVSGVGTYSVAPLSHPIKGWLMRWAYQKAADVPCISSYTEKQILKRIKLKNTRVIHLGVDFDEFQVKNYFNKSEKKEKIILSVGALKKRKGYHVSIAAVGQVRKKYPDLKYYIVGDQSIKGYFEELKQLVKENHLEENVIFLQKIPDKELIELYHQADLFLLTPVNIGNHFEGFGLVYLEANAAGLPTIGVKDCGAEDVIKDGYNGFLVPQNNISATAQAISKLIDNPELAKQLGENGKKFAQEMTWQKTIKNYLEIYRG